MTESPVRIGVAGAGTQLREYHLPTLAKLPGVELVAIANRSRASSLRVADQFGFRSIEADWQALVHRPDLDAVLVGAWPSLRCEVLLAALRAGRHVFCPGPPGLDLAEVKVLAAEALLRPGQVSVVSPSPLRTPASAYLEHLVASGIIGPVAAVDLLSSSTLHADRAVLSAQEREEVTGRRALSAWQMSGLLNRWVGPYHSLSAVATTPLPLKLDASGQEVRIVAPQVVMVAGLLASGAAGVEYHSTIVADRRTPRGLLTIHGLDGTLRHDFDTDTLSLARARQGLEPVTLPPAFQLPWQPEVAFVEAVRVARRGAPWSRGENLDFTEALACMRKIEAIHVSALSGTAIVLATL